MKILVKIQTENGYELETLEDFCKRVSRKNNATLYHLEDYLGVKLSEDETLARVRSNILDTSGDISRLHELIVIESDYNEEL